MTIDIVAFEPDKYFRSTAAEAHLIADAMKSGDRLYRRRHRHRDASVLGEIAE